MTEKAQSRARMSGRLPEGERNGLDSLVPDLLSRPADIRTAVITFDVLKITDVIEDDAKFPTIQLRKFEVITNPDDAAKVQEALGNAYRERTGSDELPFDEGEELDDDEDDDAGGDA